MNECPYMDPSPFASISICSAKVRLLTYIRPRCDLDQPRSGHDGLFARRLLIAPSGFSPVDILRVFRRRFDLFAIDRDARNRDDSSRSFSRATRRSCRHVHRFVVRSVPQHRPGDPRQFVGERDGRDVRVRTLRKGDRLAIESIRLAGRGAQC